MRSTTSAHPRRTARVGFVLGAAFFSSVALTGVADAHVEVQPDSVPGGDFAVIAFRVPNESDSASTVSVKVALPKRPPIASVQTTAMPGWTVVTTTRKLPQPIENDDGEQVTRVVSQVTWRATGGGIKPGQYEDFDLSLGTLPESGNLVFNALQTYSDGKTVNWNEVSADESVEAEHPAPTLSLTPAADAESPDAAAPDATATDSAEAQTTPAVAATDDGSDSVWPLLLSGAALVVSLLTALLVWRRGRPASDAAATVSPQLEESTR